MRTTNYFMHAIAAAAIALGLLYVAGTFDSRETESTTLYMINNSDEDSVLVYLTLGADTNFITDVKGIFGIEDEGLQGSFWLHKDSVYTYTYKGKGLSGNFSFGTPPLNCFTDEWKTGVNLFEVTINNAGTVSKAQETVDISNVAGVNAIVTYKLSGGGDWLANGEKVDSFYNESLYKNYGLKGVFPFKCDDCTKSSAPPKCLDSKKTAKPQKNHTCNVSRNAYYAGGSVTITFKGYTK